MNTQRMDFLKRMVVWMTVVCLSTGTLFAGHPEELAEKIFGYIRQSMGDSISVYLQEDIRAQVPSEAWGQVYGQLEAQFGAYRSKGGWKVDTMQGNTVVTSEVQFEKGALIFLLSVNEEGQINGIRFLPASSPPVAAGVRENEREIVVRWEEYELPGILKLPAGAGPFPVAVLVHGSGPSDRDGTLGPHKIFRDMADRLAEQGIATIRYDKRTFVYGADWEKEGTGTFDDETVNDAVAAVWQATTQPELSSVYVIGLSQGAILAPRIAQRAGDVAGIVMMAGSPRPLNQLIADQFEYLLAQEQPGVDREFVDRVKKSCDNLDLYGTAEYDASLGFPLDAGSEAYWQFAMRYDALETLRSLSVPALLLQGERDYQVTMKDYALWQQGLTDRTNVSMKSYPALNHLFFEGEGVCLPSEYEQEKPMASYVIEDIASFIHTGI